MTFFDGEIISEKHPFLTRKWDADEDVDKKHWVGFSLSPHLHSNKSYKNCVVSDWPDVDFQSKFLAFYQYAKTFNSDTFDYEELNRTDYVFMRWKEHFLVPDHTIKVWVVSEKYSQGVVFSQTSLPNRSSIGKRP